MESRKVILASHGTLSKGLKETAQMIVGSAADDILCFCLKPGHHPDEFAADLKAEIECNTSVEYVILTDLLGASVCTAMSQLLAYRNVRIFSGMNLNLLLSVLLEYSNSLTDEDCESLIADAKDGIKVLSLSQQAEEDDF